MKYGDLIKLIADLKSSLDAAVAKEETNYFGMELMVAEDYLERMIAKGRR